MGLLFYCASLGLLWFVNFIVFLWVCLNLLNSVVEVEAKRGLLFHCRSLGLLGFVDFIVPLWVCLWVCWWMLCCREHKSLRLEFHVDNFPPQLCQHLKLKYLWLELLQWTWIYRFLFLFWFFYFLFKKKINSLLEIFSHNTTNCLLMRFLQLVSIEFGTLLYIFFIISKILC